MPRRLSKPRCESLEGRVLLAASLDYPRLASAMQAAWAEPPLALAALGPPPRALDLDLDGDGLLDHAELSRPPGADLDQIDVFRGLDGGRLEPAWHSTLGFVALALHAKDFDGDGRPDLFAPGAAPGEGTLLLNQGGWCFDVGQRDATRASLAVADLTGDGLDDFVLANHLQDRVSIEVMGLGKVVFANLMFAPREVHLADVNADSKLDLIVCGGAGGILVYPGLGGGKFGEEMAFEVGLAGAGPTSVLVANLKDTVAFHRLTKEAYDPYPDLLVANQASGTVSVFLGEGGWKLRRAAELRAGLAPSAVTAGDVNGDGLPDLVVTARGADSVWILPGLGAGQFDDRLPRILPVGHLPLESFLADFDGDGRLDLAVVNSGSADVTFYSDVGSIATSARSVNSGGDGAVAALLRDVNSDGRGDLVVAHRESGQLSLLLGGVNGPSVSETLANPGGRPAALAWSADSWKVYVASEDGESAALVSFTPVAPVITDRDTGHDVPLLEPAAPAAEAKLDSPSAGAVGLFPLMVTPLYAVQDGPPPRLDEEQEVEEAADVARRATPLLSGGSGVMDEDDESTDTALTREVAVQQFLLGADDRPPPTVAADGSTEPRRVAEEDPPAPQVLIEESPVPPPESLHTGAAVNPEEAPPLPLPPEDSVVEAALLLLAVAIVRDRPIGRGRRGDRAAR